MNIKKRELREIFDCLSKTSQKAYHDIFLLSNPVLSKDPITSKFIEDFICGIDHKIFRTKNVFYRISKYYAKMSIVYFLYLSRFILYKFSQQRFEIKANEKEFILIDTFFHVNKIEKKRRYSDPYFPGLERILKKKKKEYAYLPFFYETRNPFRIYRILRTLRKERVPVLTEFQLLSIADLIQLFFFFISYPISVIKFLLKIRKTSTDSIKILINAIFESLDKEITLYGYSRYLQGKKISSLPYSKINCISWYENQSIHKNLYKGLRKTNSKVTIIGAQLFIRPETLLNLHPDEHERVFGIIPDKILVNGKYYIPLKTQLNYCVGPSLRYKYLFETTLEDTKRKSILILLPYFHDEIRDMLSVLNVVDTIKTEDLLIKFHPDTNKEIFLKSLPPGVHITEKHLYELFKVTKIVIGVATGSLVEAVTSGIPAIVISDNKRYSHSYLPALGKGIIWDYASKREGIEQLISSFNYTLAYKKAEIQNISRQYRDLFFCEPTEDKIIEAFEL